MRSNAYYLIFWKGQHLTLVECGVSWLEISRHLCFTTRSRRCCFHRRSDLHLTKFTSKMCWLHEKKHKQKKKRIKPKWNSKVKQRNIKMLITDKNDLSHFHGNNPTNHGRIHHHHPPPPPPPISGSKASNAASRKSKNYHHSQQQHPNNSYPTPNHMENKVSCSWAKFTWIERVRDLTFYYFRET